MKRISLTCLSIIFIAFTSFAQKGMDTSSVPQNSYKMMNGDSSLGQSYNRSACGLNYAVDKWIITKRSEGWPVYTPGGLGLPANLKFTKLPAIPCYKIDTALLYWIVSYSNVECFYDEDTANKYCTNVNWSIDGNDVIYCGTPKVGITQRDISSITVTNSNNITASYTGTLIGTDGSKKWGETETRVYRADVTKSILGNGTYKVDIAKDPGDIETTWQTDGMVMIVVYRDPTATYQGNLLFNDGNLTRSDAKNTCGLPTTDSITWNGACGNSTYADAFLLVSDLQQNAQKTFQATLNGKTVTDSSKFFNLTSTSTSVTKGQSVSQFGITPNLAGFDCYTLAVTGLYYQTTSCVTCVPQDTSTSLTLTKSSTPAMCGNNNGTATVSPSGGARPYKYSWSPYGGTDSVAKNLAPGTYKVVISDNACKSKVDSVVVTTAGGFTLPHSAQTNVTCFNGSDGTATAAPTGGKQPYTISWNTSPVQTTAKATSLKAGIYYTVTVQDGDGCVLKDSVMLIQPNDLVLTTKADSAYCGQANGTATVTVVSGGTTPYSYLWGTTPAHTSATATGLKAGVYTVSVKYPSSAMCHKDTTVTVPNAGGFKATFTKTDALCFGDSSGTAQVVPSGGKRPYAYTWSSGGGTDSVSKKLKAGTYIVTTTDSNKCVVTLSITIGQPTAVVVIANDTSICISDSAFIHTAASGGISPYTYSWNNSVGTSSQTVKPTTTTNYIITITDSNKCKKTDTATVKVTQPPIATVSSSVTIDLCTNDSVTLTISAPGATSYLWKPTNDTTSSITVRPNTTSIYTVTAATDNCLSIEASDTVYVTTTKVTSDFSATPAKGTTPLTVNFTNNSVNGNTYIWIFGDNSSESYLSNPPSHIYDSAGTYIAKLIAIDGSCSDTSSKLIEVIPVSSLGLPNIFTPNGDTKNDRFKPIIQKNIATLTVIIYNRWGEKMYEWTGTSVNWDGWDGKTKGGSSASDGVYYYILEAIGLDEKPYHEKGFVTLIRGK